MNKATRIAVGVVLTVGLSASASDVKFGALAYNSRTGAFGYAIDHGSRQSAENGALRECGSGCSVAVYFRNTCGAYAVGAKGGTGYAFGTRDQARNTAVKNCSKYDNGCVVKVWACTTS